MTQVSSGATAVPASGSQPVQLASPGGIGSVLIYASAANAGPVYLGGPGVTSSTGVPVAAGTYVAADIGDIGSIYLAGTENDTVRWMSGQRT